MNQHGPRNKRNGIKIRIYNSTRTNHTFSKNEALDNTIAHIQLTHALNEKEDNMEKLDIILDLPKQKTKIHNNEKYRCIICWKTSTVKLPKGITINIYNLQPGELIHIDFYFLDETSIRQFTCTLVVIDVKLRKTWIFCTPGKQNPLTTVILFSGVTKTDG